MLKAAKAYLVTQVTTASQGDLLLMLYDTAVKHLRQAIEKMRAGDVAGKGILITKAIDIISELQESLNKERGGDISKNLFQLYFFCNTRLLKANLQMNTDMVEEVISILFGLRQAFAQIMPTVDGVASIAQQGMGAEGAAAVAASEARTQEAASARPAENPAADPAGDLAAEPAGDPAGEPGAEPTPAPEAAPAAPVNPMRFRAANAYATSR